MGLARYEVGEDCVAIPWMYTLWKELLLHPGLASLNQWSQPAAKQAMSKGSLRKGASLGCLAVALHTFAAHSTWQLHSLVDSILLMPVTWPGHTGWVMWCPWWCHTYWQPVLVTCSLWKSIKVSTARSQEYVCACSCLKWTSSFIYPWQFVLSMANEVETLQYLQYQDFEKSPPLPSAYMAGLHETGISGYW